MASNQLYSFFYVVS